MDRISTTVRMDRSMRDMLDVLANTQGVAINALIVHAISAFINRETKTIERDLSATLEQVRAYRVRYRDHRAAIDALVEAEASLPDPAEADRVFKIKGSAEAALLSILDEA